MAGPNKKKQVNLDIKASFPVDPEREAAYAQICAKGLELKSYKVDPEELKNKYGKPKEPIKPQWPYTGHPQEAEDVENLWSKERVIEEVQALMDELGIECLPSAQMLDERNRNLKFQVWKYHKGLKNLAEAMNIKTWHQAKQSGKGIEEADVVEHCEVEEKVHETEEKVQDHTVISEMMEIVEEAKPTVHEQKTLTERIRERKAREAQPLPEDPHNNMRFHYDRFKDRICELKKELEEAEHHLDGFIFAAEVMGIEL